MKIHQGSLRTTTSAVIVSASDRDSIPRERLPGPGLDIAQVAQPVEILEVVPGFDDPERLHCDDGDDESQLTPSRKKRLDFAPRDDVVQLVRYEEQSRGAAEIPRRHRLYWFDVLFVKNSGPVFWLNYSPAIKWVLTEDEGAMPQSKE